MGSKIFISLGLVFLTTACQKVTTRINGSGFGGSDQVTKTLTEIRKRLAAGIGDGVENACAQQFGGDSARATRRLFDLLSNAPERDAAVDAVTLPANLDRWRDLLETATFQVVNVEEVPETYVSQGKVYWRASGTKDKTENDLALEWLEALMLLDGGELGRVTTNRAVCLLASINSVGGGETSPPRQILLEQEFDLENQTVNPVNWINFGGANTYYGQQMLKHRTFRARDGWFRVKMTTRTSPMMLVTRLTGTLDDDGIAINVTSDGGAVSEFRLVVLRIRSSGYTSVLTEYPLRVPMSWGDEIEAGIVLDGRRVRAYLGDKSTPDIVVDKLESGAIGVARYAGQRRLTVESLP